MGKKAPDPELTPALTEDEAEWSKLVSIVEKWTDIATKNRLNADYVPGMVTVLYGKDLEALGIRTVWEALSLVPGIDTSLEREGFTQTIVRGAVTVLVPLNLKILLDKIPLKTEIGLSSVVKMPVEQIERIEIIRGPGSAIHGEFALLGVVNIITRKKINQVFSSYGSFDTYEYGGILSRSDPLRDLHLNLNFSGWNRNGTDVQAGPDALYGMGMGAISNAPGPANEKENFCAGLLNLDYKKFTLSLRWLESGQGDFFGIGYALPTPDNRIVFREKQWGVAAVQALDLPSSLHADFTIGFQDQRFEGNDGYWYPPGFTIPLPSGSFLEYPDGWNYGFNYEERLIHSGIDLIWQGLNRHTFLLGGSFSRTDYINTWLRTNMDWSQGQPPPPSDQPVIEYAEDKHRNINSIILQDEFCLNEQLTITSGFRDDHYNDLGEMFSPRIAAVWRLTKSHVLKTQYARSFRPPTFYEMYSPTNPILLKNPDLKQESIDTGELGYIYKGTNTVWRFTTFYSEFKGKIFEDTTSGMYKNSDDIDHFKGVEGELEQRLGPLLKCDANLSYVTSEDRISPQLNARGANWLANLSTIWQPKSNCTLTAHCRYVGPREREPLDSRGDMREYYTVDITSTIFNCWLKGITLGAGIKNVFDEDVRYPAPLERYGAGANPYPSYPEDFPRTGRQWWLKLSYTF